MADSVGDREVELARILTALDSSHDPQVALEAALIELERLNRQHKKRSDTRTFLYGAICGALSVAFPLVYLFFNHH